jgi:hypothetical protein
LQALDVEIQLAALKLELQKEWRSSWDKPGRREAKQFPVLPAEQAAQFRLKVSEETRRLTRELYPSVANRLGVNPEVANAEAANAEAQAVNLEAANSDVGNSEAANSEAANSDDANYDVGNLEAANSEVADSEVADSELEGSA